MLEDLANRAAAKTHRYLFPPRPLRISPAKIPHKRGEELPRLLHRCCQPDTVLRQAVSPMQNSTDAARWPQLPLLSVGSISSRKYVAILRPVPMKSSTRTMFFMRCARIECNVGWARSEEHTSELQS